MKKTINFIILLLAMSCSAIARSQSVEESSPGFVLLDVVFYRPALF